MSKEIELICSCGGIGQVYCEWLEEGDLYYSCECTKCGYSTGAFIGQLAEEAAIEAWEESQHRRTVWG